MTLPPRTEEALRLAVHGRKEAARRMGIADDTVKRHLERAYNLLGVYSLLEAYLSLGWLRIPGEDAEHFDERAA